MIGSTSGLKIWIILLPSCHPLTQKRGGPLPQWFLLFFCNLAHPKCPRGSFTFSSRSADTCHKLSSTITSETNLALHINDALLWDITHELDHLFGHFLPHSQHTLYSAGLTTNDKEGLLSWNNFNMKVSDKYPIFSFHSWKFHFKLQHWHICWVISPFPLLVCRRALTVMVRLARLRPTSARGVWVFGRFSWLLFMGKFPYRSLDTSSPSPSSPPWHTNNILT